MWNNFLETTANAIHQGLGIVPTKKMLKIRQQRLNNPQYPFDEIKKHLATDIVPLANQYNFVGKGIVRNFPHIDKNVKLDKISPQEHFTELILPDIHGKFYPESMPGDQITFVVYCEVTVPPKPKRVAQCKFHLLFYELTTKGPFHLETTMMGPPKDFEVSYDRYIRSCGVQALQQQRCRNYMYNSRIFDRFLKGRKIRWKFTRTKAKQLLKSSHLKPEVGPAGYEDTSLINLPKNFKVGLNEQIWVEGQITTQGGKITNHVVSVTCLYRLQDWSPDGKVRMHRPLPQQPQNFAPHPAGFVPQGQQPQPQQFPPAQYPPQGQQQHPPQQQYPQAQVQHPNVQAGHYYPQYIANKAANPVAVAQKSAAAAPQSAAVAPQSAPVDPSVQNGSETQCSECVVCLDEDPTHAFIPCGHKCVCHDCGDSIMQDSKMCPLCRSKVAGVMKIYA